MLLLSAAICKAVINCHCHKRHARGLGGEVRGASTPRHFPSTKLNQVCFCQLLCLCMVLWKIICADESQWEIVLITTQNDGSIIVCVALMHLAISDDDRVIGSVFVFYGGLSRQQWDPFFGYLVSKTTSDLGAGRWPTMSAKNVPGDKVNIVELPANVH